MNKKKFDCVELQHKGGFLVNKETAGMTIEEELKYWQKQERSLQSSKRQHRSEYTHKEIKGVKYG